MEILLPETNQAHYPLLLLHYTPNTIRLTPYSLLSARPIVCSLVLIGYIHASGQPIQIQTTLEPQYIRFVDAYRRN